MVRDMYAIEDGGKEMLLAAMKPIQSMHQSAVFLTQGSVSIALNS